MSDGGLMFTNDTPRQPRTVAAHKLMRDILEVKWKSGQEESWLPERLSEIEDATMAMVYRDLNTPRATYSLQVTREPWWRRILR